MLSAARSLSASSQRAGGICRHLHGRRRHVSASLVRSRASKYCTARGGRSVGGTVHRESLTDAESRRTLSQRVVCEPHLIESQQRPCQRPRASSGVARSVCHCGANAEQSRANALQRKHNGSDRIGARPRAPAAGRISRGSADCTVNSTQQQQ